MTLLRFYRHPGFSLEERETLLRRVQRTISPEVEEIQTEYCFYLELLDSLSNEEIETLKWLLSETFESQLFGETSFLGDSCLEVGPRMSFTTAWCTNAVSIFHSCGLRKIKRIERSRRFRIQAGQPLSPEGTHRFLNMIHDRMTECPYDRPLQDFSTGIIPEKPFEIPVMQEGRTALERINQEMGLAFDDWDLDYYTKLFTEAIGRNPTNVECFDIAQSNSEHSRHWFFKGRLMIDGVEAPEHLIAMLTQPLNARPNNSTIAFKDNSSAIRGFSIQTIVPADPGQPSPFRMIRPNYDILFTAETHNFPSGVAPFPGAETGTGGRIRDVHATGKGSLVVAGTAAYCVGNLRIPGYDLPWEDSSFLYPANLASPLQIEIEASNGASDYGNKFGEPVIQGYTRSFGLRTPSGERREWIKPIMFSGGIGQIDSIHSEKDPPLREMWVVKIGGPAYRIGMGGGAASSMVQGENVAELDFNAVQRGDAEMEQKVNRVIRACVEMGPDNPIVSIHDQGAGGNCNVLKEIVEPEGAQINLREILLGDETLSVLEIWGAEYQENDALLLRPEHGEYFKRLCQREKVPVAFVGRITGDGKIVLYDSEEDSTPVNLELEKVLGSMPQKKFVSNRIPPVSKPLKIPEGTTISQALDRVLRLLSVGSKRFLTNKVDRSVTGLVARQQCAGPLQLTVADVAVIAQSHFGTTGAATAIGEKPILGILNPASMARMTVGEALTNLVWAPVSQLEDVKCSGNWMWAGKLPGEGAAIYDAAKALRDILIDLGIAIDGGKDSLSMAALAPLPDGRDETVKAPGSLVISAYVTCPDIEKIITPDLKMPDKGKLIYVDLGNGRNRLGASSLAHVYGQLGESAPDIEQPDQLKRAFLAVQKMIENNQILSGHDRSDGGLITTLLEMAFSGNCGIDIHLPFNPDSAIETLFSEELGLVMEVPPEEEQHLLAMFHEGNIPCIPIGQVTKDPHCRIRMNDRIVLDEPMIDLRDIWEETSYQIETLQANPVCAEQERKGLRKRSSPAFQLTFNPSKTPWEILNQQEKPKVAVIREEGSNGDREMVSAFYSAGFETWDVTMSDLLTGRIQLDSFRGIVFVGGFSYADVLDSAKGWAGVIQFNRQLREQFDHFYERQDTFSLGICNGCQLMALLGWVPLKDLSVEQQPRFIQNSSGRFESRFTTLRIEDNPSIMLKNMAGSVLGVWVAHGEGRAYFPDDSILQKVTSEQLVPARFVDDQGQPTQVYPFNPNGSPNGIAGLCSKNGRHLAMMPHPERAFLKWQWGWMPEEWKKDLECSPWLQMFQNARNWCGKIQD